MKSIEISQEQFDVLNTIAYLVQLNKKATQQKIADKLKKSRATVSMLIMKLIKKDLIKSTTSAGYFFVKNSVKVIVLKTQKVAYKF